jgi:hypothetical protein
MARLLTIWIYFLMLMGASFFVQAQSFRGGIHAGLTASEVSGDRSGGPNKLGWFASVFTDFPVSEQSYWHLELMYTHKGSREFIDREGYFRDYTFSLRYVEVPLLYKFNFSVFGRLPYARWLSAEMGVSASSVIGHFETNDEGVNFTDEMARERPFYPVELNIILGVGVPLGETLTFQVRYNQGVTPLRDHASGRKVWYNRGQYNSVWSMGLSVTLF